MNRFLSRIALVSAWLLLGLAATGKPTYQILDNDTAFFKRSRYALGGFMLKPPIQPGKYKVYYHNNPKQIKSVFEYKANAEEGPVLHNTYSFWDTAGHLLFKQQFDMGELDGKSIFLYPNGQAKVVANYEHNIPVGKFEVWSQEGKPLVSYDLPRPDLPPGFKAQPDIKIDQQGELRVINGEKIRSCPGPSLIWHPNGNLIEAGLFYFYDHQKDQNGRYFFARSGEFLRFHENGQLAVKQYVKDVRITRLNLENGNVEVPNPMNLDTILPPDQFEDHARKYMQALLRANIQHAAPEQKIFSHDLDLEEYFPSGKIKEKVVLGNEGTLTIRKFYENGTVAFEMPYQFLMDIGRDTLLQAFAYANQGAINRQSVLYKDKVYIAQGQLKQWREDGTMEFLSNYFFGYLQGESLNYYDNGNLRSKISFVQNAPEGPASYHYEVNGAVRESGVYKDKHKYGAWKNFDPQGNEVKVTHHAAETVINSQTMSAVFITSSGSNLLADSIIPLSQYATAIKAFMEDKMKAKKRLSTNQVDLQLVIEEREEGQYLVHHQFLGPDKDTLMLHQYDSLGNLTRTTLYTKAPFNTTDVMVASYLYHYKKPHQLEYARIENDLYLAQRITSYYPNSKVHDQALYTNGMLTQLLEFDETGQLRSKKGFLYGVNHGEWVTFDPNGKVIRDLYFNKGRRGN